MATLNPELLYSRTSDSIDSNFHATTGAHGLYNTQQFVLRLSPKIHHLLGEHNKDIVTSADVSFETFQAMSTYLHETVHWWQHIGSTYGFIFSLNYPMQSHATHGDLVKLVNAEGFKKSVIQQADELGRAGPSGFGTPAGRANTIINNHYDLLTFRAFSLGPEVAKEVIQENLFENVGHAFHMTYGHTVNILGSTVDRNFKTLCHPKHWQEGFRELRDNKIEGYYYGSSVGLWSIGSVEIFEGQARFSQLQYLSFGSNHKLTMDDFRQRGMLFGIYTKAFDHFLDMIEEDWPQSVDDPLVGLFLLVCDYALNPGSGFPYSVAPHFNSFITDVNPGARFTMAARQIRSVFPAMKGAVREYSRDEYIEVTSTLADSLYDHKPIAISKTCASWFDLDGPMGFLRSEFDNYEFDLVNFPIRHLLSHFLAFQQDKFKRPEFFCWPGAWMAGEKLDERSRDLFYAHSALFVDKEHDDSIFPSLQTGRSEASVHNVFNIFYQHNLSYDLTNQWISAPGPFRYNAKWLVANADQTEIERYMKQSFKSAFGFSPDLARVYSS